MASVHTVAGVVVRRGLGRGLDALLPTDPASAPEARERGGLLKVDLDRIEPNPHQPRSHFDDDALADLATSIRNLGLLQPLLVRPTGDGFQLIAGERRWRAARAAGLTEVPVVVVETDDRGSLERALVENVHRADLNPIEEAAAYKQLIEDADLTQEALGQKLGRNRVTITNALRLLDLPVPIQRYLIEGRITAAHGKALLGLQGNPLQERVARRVVETGMSARETEEMVRRFQAMTGVQPRSSSKTSQPEIGAEVQRSLADHLQTRVRVEMGKRKGKIVIDFVSLDELERLRSVIVGAQEGATVSVAAPD